jgi:hypothetical protein
MTTGGRAIPRLQELSYLEVTARAVANGIGFEEMRLRLIDHMIQVGEASPGTGNVASYRTAKTNPKRYVRNVSESLKELMRLGMVEQATLPSKASTAVAYKSTTYALTGEGKAWVELLHSDRRAAYDHLCELLLMHHPQVAGYLKALGAVGSEPNASFIVPLLRWGDLERDRRSRENFISALAAVSAQAITKTELGWQSSESEIKAAIQEYVSGIEARAEAKAIQHPDHRPSEPFARNQDFVNACEEALVKFAFTRAGTPIDYISMEILRRWCRTLGVANFSYHAPGPYALRLWPTAELEVTANGLAITRRVGDSWREQVIVELKEAYDAVRRAEPTGSLWVPIFRVRAAVCWKLRIPDSEFDSAVLELLRNERGPGLPYGVNLDQASYGSIPPSERPLVVAAPTGIRIFKSMSLVPRSPERTKS